jgi:hypothetical protein
MTADTPPFDKESSLGLAFLKDTGYQPEFLKPLDSQWQIVAVYPPEGQDVTHKTHMAIINEASAREQQDNVSFYHPNVAGKMG